MVSAAVVLTSLVNWRYVGWDGAVAAVIGLGDGLPDIGAQIVAPPKSRMASRRATVHIMLISFGL